MKIKTSIFTVFKYFYNYIIGVVQFIIFSTVEAVQFAAIKYKSQNSTKQKRWQDMHFPLFLIENLL